MSALSFILGYLAGVITWMVYLHVRATKEMRRRAAENQGQDIQPATPWPRAGHIAPAEPEPLNLYD